MDPDLNIPTDSEGSPGAVGATRKLRDHGFTAKRDRTKIRPTPSLESRERAQWIYWLATHHYDFAVDDPQDIPAHLSFEVWRAKKRLGEFD